METGEMLLLGGLIVLMAIMCGYYARSKKRIRKLLFGSLSGVALLFPAQMILTGMGQAIMLNLFTVSVAAVLGIPGTVLLIITACL